MGQHVARGVGWGENGSLEWTQPPFRKQEKMEKPSLPWKRITAEFLIIFAGVTLSLAADDWRQAREERSSEIGFLHALEEDLTADSVNLARMKYRMESYDETALWLERRLDGPDLPPDSLETVRRLLFRTFFRPVASAYVSLKAGGQMSLIQDAELRRMIVEYYEVQQPYMAGFNSSVENDYARWETSMQKYFRLSPADSVDSFWPMPPIKTTQAWRTLAEDEEARAHLGTLGLGAANWALRINGVIEENVALRGALKRDAGG